MNSFKTLFIKERNIIIGAIHFPPMPGYYEYPGFDVALDNAIADLKAFEHGGVDALIIENNYDIPHTEHISAEAKQTMIDLGKKIKEQTKLPVGVSVLWNDYRSAFGIAHAIGGAFIRIPVFVDEVETSYGIMKEQADNVAEFRSMHNFQHIQIYVDIHVKHAKILSTHNIAESAQMAIQKGADALIITGKWTGDAPQTDDLATVREEVGDFPILCGSGVDASNAKSLFAFANGAIVSTSVKTGAAGNHVNIKAYDERVDAKKVRELVNAL